MFVFGERSRKNLQGVNPDLIRLAERALKLSPIDFMILDGLRTKEEQLVNIRKGVSKTKNSAHLVGCAIDFVPWRDTDGDGDAEVSWARGAFKPIAGAFEKAAVELGIPITKGIEWGAEKDADGIGWDPGHIELDDAKYGWKAKSAALWK